ncbi:MAG: hypothetical protein JW774_12720 [Candidatus Aureabacteria bacterium]|nr:hypothetical protein [Candidatus Auribacterota bacterium]
MDITLPFIHLEKIIETQVVDRKLLNEHLNVDDPEIILFKKKEPPRVKVTFSRMEPKEPSDEVEVVSFPVNNDSRVEMVINSKSGKPLQYHLTPIKSCFLWDLHQFKKVDLLRCGRFKHNDFLPLIRENPLEMDLGVSREHSLIGFYNSKIYYIDYGTSTRYAKSQEVSNPAQTNLTHFGSKNGSWLYQDYIITDCIKNMCVLWEIPTVVGIGTFFYNVSINDKKLKLFHHFSFSYEML